MLVCRDRFNLILILAGVFVLVCSCQSPETARKKHLADLRIHIEATGLATNRTSVAEVYRSAPIAIPVDRTPFLNEENVKECKVVDVTGGFALQFQLDKTGTLLLQQYTSNNRGKHLLIWSQFAVPTEPNKEEGRWLAAPLITAPISDGVLVFTPDANREEAEQVAVGLNNVAKKLHTGEESTW